MDPLTAALVALASVIDLAKEIVKSQPPDVAAELWRLHLEDVKAWREFVRRLTPSPTSRVEGIAEPERMPELGLPELRMIAKFDQAARDLQVEDFIASEDSARPHRSSSVATGSARAPRRRGARP